ncbi:MAG: asparagine synthase C-terminal domain-containing protein [Candidatus Syntrophosphaera sp.]|nr:asparagine synthase C-terminal domain-containing protein [Candidatus Syntrophosphaera sp.]
MEKSLTDKSLNRGYLWHGGKFHAQISEQIFPEDCSEVRFASILKESDGCFRLVLDREHHIFAAVDRIRSLPLFYALHNNALLLSHDAFELRSRLKTPGLDQNALTEFLLAGYTCLGDTLCPGLKQLEAGQYLVWDKLTQTLEVRDYFIYRQNFDHPADPLAELDKMHERVFSRLIESAAGRTIVVPLSGGLDSRLIAVMLKRLGYPKVMCYTFGSSLQDECVTSRKVARFLNLPWTIIETNRRMWYQAYHSDEMRRYFRFGTNLSSLPHVHDWLAVKQLQERKLIPPDAIIVPGHSGGMFQGADLPLLFENREEITARELLDAILKEHYDLWYCPNDRRNKLFGQRVGDQLQIPENVKVEIAASIFDEWDWRQRQSKLYVNSLRIYDFFGYDWYLPLWDMEYIDFWTRVPLQLRMRRELMNQYAKKCQSVPIPAYNDYPLSRRIHNRYARMQAGNLPDQRYGRFLDYRNRHDYLFTKVSSLLAPNLAYPDFVNPDLNVLDANINALQALYYIRELVSGRLDQ